MFSSRRLYGCPGLVNLLLPGCCPKSEHCSKVRAPLKTSAIPLCSAAQPTQHQVATLTSHSEFPHCDQRDICFGHRRPGWFFFITIFLCLWQARILRGKHVHNSSPKNSTATANWVWFMVAGPLLGFEVRSNGPPFECIKIGMCLCLTPTTCV